MVIDAKERKVRPNIIGPILFFILLLLFLISSFVNAYLEHYHHIKIQNPDFSLYILFGLAFLESVFGLRAWFFLHNGRFLYIAITMGICALILGYSFYSKNPFIIEYSQYIWFFLFISRFLNYNIIALIQKPFIVGYFRPILELAGRNVNGIQDGFSNRPYPVSKIDASKYDIVSFVRKMERMFIAQYSIIEKERAILYLNGASSGYNNSTYVEFDWEGNMSVNIAKRDYEKYKEELTFDQLCKALGELVLKFFELYKEGKEKEILGMLRSATK
jgi:hypothetical protein